MKRNEGNKVVCGSFVWLVVMVTLDICNLTVDSILNVMDKWGPHYQITLYFRPGVSQLVQRAHSAAASRVASGVGVRLPILRPDSSPAPQNDSCVYAVWSNW